MSNIHRSTIQDADYPPLLKEIHDPPAVLYFHGNIKILHHTPLLAVVGSRKITNYGKHAIHLLLPRVVQTGAIIVSGLALGVDAAAHRTAVELGKPTIAVLGGGIDEPTIYPRSNFGLSQKILKTGGILISEYPPGTPAFAHAFPKRNRIIAGLAQATLIIEAAQRSGSLITARCALESGRDVLAVPGNITQPQSEGCNRLIHQGAEPILTCQDLLDRLSLSSVPHDHTASATTEPERKILEALAVEPLSVDKLFEICRLNITTFHQTLSDLELKGLIIKTGEELSIST